MIKFTLIPKKWHNLSYYDIEKKINLDNYDCVLIGFSKYDPPQDDDARSENSQYYNQINPPNKKTQEMLQGEYNSKSVKFDKTTILNAEHDNDMLIYISTEIINF